MECKFGKLFLIGIALAFLSISSNISFSLSLESELEDKADSFSPTNCTQDSDCEDLCHKGNFLYSRCDVNGTCICDCSDPKIVNSSYTTACSGRQPEGYWWDHCDTYCRQEYRRPCRYCSADKSQFFCTCVCNYPTKSNEDDEQFIPK